MRRAGLSTTICQIGRGRLGIILAVQLGPNQRNEKGTGVRGSCGAHYGGYLSGGHPTAQEEEINRKVYFDDGVGNNKI